MNTICNTLFIYLITIYSCTCVYVYCKQSLNELCTLAIPYNRHGWFFENVSYIEPHAYSQQHTIWQTKQNHIWKKLLYIKIIKTSKLAYGTLISNNHILDNQAVHNISQYLKISQKQQHNYWFNHIIKWQTVTTLMLKVYFIILNR